MASEWFIKRFTVSLKNWTHSRRVNCLRADNCLSSEEREEEKGKKRAGARESRQNHDVQCAVRRKVALEMIEKTCCEETVVTCSLVNSSVCSLHRSSVQAVNHAIYCSGSCRCLCNLWSEKVVSKPIDSNSLLVHCSVREIAYDQFYDLSTDEEDVWSHGHLKESLFPFINSIYWCSFRHTSWLICLIRCNVLSTIQVTGSN